MVTALIGISGNAPRRAAAEQADDDELAALGQAVEPELPVVFGVADQVDQRHGSAAAFLANCSKRVGGSAIDGWQARRPAPRASRLRRVDIDDDGALAAHRFEQRQRHQAKAARTEMTIGVWKAKSDFLQTRCRW